MIELAKAQGGAAQTVEGRVRRPLLTPPRDSIGSVDGLNIGSARTKRHLQTILDGGPCTLVGSDRIFCGEAFATARGPIVIFVEFLEWEGDLIPAGSSYMTRDALAAAVHDGRVSPAALS